MARATIAHSHFEPAGADWLGRPGNQTASRSRAPVSDEGWRSFDMARASI